MYTFRCVYVGILSDRLSFVNQLRCMYTNILRRSRYHSVMSCLMYTFHLKLQAKKINKQFLRPNRGGGVHAVLLQQIWRCLRKYRLICVAYAVLCDVTVMCHKLSVICYTCTFLLLNPLNIKTCNNRTNVMAESINKMQQKKKFETVVKVALNVSNLVISSLFIVVVFFSLENLR